jgi:hypothetical protein
MRKKEINKYNMYQNVLGIFKTETEFLDSNSIVNQAVTDLTKTLASIENLSQDYVSQKNTSIINRKNEIEDQIIDDADVIVAALKLYANLHNDTEIAASVSKYTKTELNNMRDQELIIAAKVLADKASSKIESLTELNVNAEKVTKFNENINEFSKLINDKEVIDSDRKTTRLNLDTEFDKANDLVLNKLDLLIKINKASNTELFNRYESARVIFDR